MPQEWISSWPLPDGSSGVNWKEPKGTNSGDQRAEATARQHSSAVLWKPYDHYPSTELGRALSQAELTRSPRC
jgi:hypothetical protein